MLSQQDYYDKAKAYALLKDTEGKYFTYDEYRDLIKTEQTDKDGNVTYLYAQNREAQYSYIKAAQDKGYSVLLMDGELDAAMLGLLEEKQEKTRFVRVDSDTVGRLIPKDDNASEVKDADTVLNLMFKTQMPKLNKVEFNVDAQSLGADSAPVTITQSEYMRRMKEMARLQPGMSFYGEMPDMMNIVLNTDHPLIKRVMDEGEAATADALKPIEQEIKGLDARRQVIEQEQRDKKWDEISQESKDDLDKTRKDIDAQKAKKTDVVAGYAKDNSTVHQLIDLALLQNGLLQGEALSNFIKRSIDIIK